MFRISCDRNITTAKLGSSEGDIVLSCAAGVTSQQAVAAIMAFLKFFAPEYSPVLQVKSVVLDDLGQSGTVGLE